MPRSRLSSTRLPASPALSSKKSKLLEPRNKGKLRARPFDVLAVSDMCVDVVLTGNVRPQFHQVEQIIGDCSLELGGSANIFAAQLAKLGAHAGVLGWIGKDLFGDFCLQQLKNCRVDTTWVRRHPDLKTGIGFALAEPDDRAILTYMGTIDATQPAHLNKNILTTCRHWHIASFFLLTSLRSSWHSWLRKCRSSGVTTSLDTNWDPQNQWADVLELLPHIDIFFPNEAEALAITRSSDVYSAAKTLAAGGSLIVLKRGEKGVLVQQRERSWELPPITVAAKPLEIIDSTGAGDNFDAGFLHAWLNGKNIEACVQLGQRCAVSSLAALGGIRGQLKQKSLPRKNTKAGDK